MKRFVEIAIYSASGLWVVPYGVSGQLASSLACEQFEFVRHIGAHGKLLPAWLPPFIPRPSARDRDRERKETKFACNVLCDACSFKLNDIHA